MLLHVDEGNVAVDIVLSALLGSVSQNGGQIKICSWVNLEVRKANIPCEETFFFDQYHSTEEASEIWFEDNKKTDSIF